MTPESSVIIRWIDARLDEILASPRAWGSTPESLEFQLLTLLEVRGILRGYDPTGPQDGEWRRLFTLVQGGAGYLSDQFARASVDDPLFLETIRAAVMEVTRRQDAKAELDR